jgi:hypothetical protein
MPASTPAWSSDSEAPEAREPSAFRGRDHSVPVAIPGPGVILMPALPSISLDDPQLPLPLLWIPDSRCAVHALVMPGVLVGR